MSKIEIDKLNLNKTIKKCDKKNKTNKKNKKPNFYPSLK